MEQALRSCRNARYLLGPKGTRPIYRLAEDNLNLGLTVIADLANPLEITREAWAEVAHETNVRLINVEIVCSDETEHRRRVETRSSDIPDLVLPTWDKVKSREYHPWAHPRILIDTAGRSVGVCLDELMSQLVAVRSA